MSLQPESQPPQKVFIQKYPLLKIQEDYRVIDCVQFWDNFPKNYVCPAKPWLLGEELRKLADAVGCSDEDRLKRVLNWIKNGAEIGCAGRFRAPAIQSNTKASYSVGPQVTDAIAAWVDEGLAYGPVDETDVPAEAKINSILTRPKPNGTVRIILNLSAPVGSSVNEGIDIDDYPASMSSTEAWLRVLNKAGKDCWFTKTDWANAYKHITVAEQDTNLQWFEWGGKFFKELCLIFGCSSSAGIFDATAKLVLDLVCRVANFPPEMLCQHLDDVCAAAAAHKKKQLEEFDAAFQQVARTVGVRLAPRTDPDKSFAPSKSGVVFGILYNSVDWTWAIPQEKLQRLLLFLREILESE